MNPVAETARLSGVVGAGGAGFPTHIKLDARVECVVANGAECEPLLGVDQGLLMTRGEEIARMLEEVRGALCAREAVIAVKAGHGGSVEAARSVIARYPAIRLAVLDDNYPAGDEFVLVHETTGRLVPQGGIPLQVGVVVLNVETLWNLAAAGAGHPVTHKWVTVAGAVPRPGTFRVPLGVSVSQVIGLAGGPGVPDFAVLSGGVMMGRLVGDLEEPIVKTTKGLIVLPADSPVVQLRARPLAAVLRQARAACCQCRLCTDLCPRSLLGHELYPHRVMMAVSHAGRPAETATAAFLCSECGLCDLYACPMGLSPRRVNQAIKLEMSRLGVKNPHRGPARSPHPWHSYRRVPVKRLVSRLGLKPYERPAPLLDPALSPDRVVLPLRQHAGDPAEPVVRVGEMVETGRLVAEVPASGRGSRLFASIPGMVTEVTQSRVVISRGGVGGGAA